MATATSLAAAAVSPFPTCSSRRKHLPIFAASLVLRNTRSPTSRLFIAGSQLGFGPFSAYSGLKHLGIISFRRSTKEVKRRCRGRVVYASLFGVGAPEALVIGVVALLVFGPKGLAEVARNLGKTLRAFQPTIRELQEVSREFKSTLEREIGLDEAQSSLQSTYKPSTPVDKNPKITIDQTTQTSHEVATTSAAPDASATPVLESSASEATLEGAGTTSTPKVAVSLAASDVDAPSAGPEANFAITVTNEVSSEEKQPMVQ